VGLAACGLESGEKEEEEEEEDDADEVEGDD
jgi:hypothetical protein